MVALRVISGTLLEWNGGTGFSLCGFDFPSSKMRTG
jgi:hypothetical protein